MKAHEIALPLLVLVLLALAVNWQFSRMADKATSPDESGVIPVYTPVTSPLCTAQNDYCKDLDFGVP
jgi:hypothetical protein